MGKHFDKLIEIVKKYINEQETSAYIPNIKKYLTKIINRTALFEFPLLCEEIFPRSGKDKQEYRRYMYDYFELSEQNDSNFITPFKITGIEDKISVVIIENQYADKYIITSCSSEKAEKGTLDCILCGYLSIEKNKENDILIKVKAVYNRVVLNNKKMIGPLELNHSLPVGYDLKRAASAYIEQLIYIMDPENFIIQKEHNQSITQKKKQKKKKILRKTIMRPHYICLSEQDTKSFLRREAKEPRPTHPVRGHWRIFIKQYFTGKGKIIADNGWNYQVIVKESPTKLTPYSKITS